MNTAAGQSETAEQIAKLHKDLEKKATFSKACRALAEIPDTCKELSDAEMQALADAGERAFKVLQARFSQPKFWQAGLDLFLALEFHVSVAEKAATWRDAALQEVDDEARARAEALRKQRRLEEDRMHNKGWSDNPVSIADLLAANGLDIADLDEDKRPPMSREARHELKLVTVLEEDICVVCQEAMPAGSKAKQMPCGHLFHDDCLISWVSKNNSCPTCRFDEMPSEKRHFDDIARRVQQSGAQSSGLYS